MCKGLAISINGKGQVLCKGLSSHDKTKRKLNPTEQDRYLDFEIILPKWKTPVWDSGDDTCIRYYQKLGLLEDGKPRKEMMKALKTWIKNNEFQILKWFVENPELHSHQTIKGDQYQWSQTIQGDQHQSDQTIKGDQDQEYQTIKGNQHQRSQTIQGHQYQRSQTIQGHQDQRNQTIKGKVFIRHMTVGNKETTKLIKEWSESKQKEYTLSSFLNWLKEKWKNDGWDKGRRGI